MSKIYIPSEYLNSPCKVVNANYIRAYTNQNLTDYVDIYFNQDYMLRTGYSNYGYSGTCDSLNTYTDDFWYRQDFDKSLTCFLIIFIFVFVLPFKVLFRFFRRFN